MEKKYTNNLSIPFSTTLTKKANIIIIYLSISINNKVVFPGGNIIYQLSPADNSQLIWPKADKL